MKRGLGMMIGLLAFGASISAQSNQMVYNNSKMSVPKKTYKNKRTKKKRK